jgi:hypothetical protein
MRSASVSYSLLPVMFPSLALLNKQWPTAGMQTLMMPLMELIKGKLEASENSQLEFGKVGEGGGSCLFKQ